MTFIINSIKGIHSNSRNFFNAVEFFNFAFATPEEKEALNYFQQVQKVLEFIPHRQYYKILSVPL